MLCERPSSALRDGRHIGRRIGWSALGRAAQRNPQLIQHLTSRICCIERRRARVGVYRDNPKVRELLPETG
jgi:hypothetical protein